MNFPISFYIPNDIKLKCTKEKEQDLSNQNDCQYLDELLKKIYESNLFTDLSFDYKNYHFLKHSKYIDYFILNTWHIPDDEIVLINDQNFRLVMPFNDDINYN